MQDAPTETPASYDAFGLGAGAMTLATRLFAQSTKGLGIDGAKVFRSFVETGSLKQALNVSDAAVDALYARAHQQFAIGQIRNAEEIFRALCALDGSKSDYWLGLGICTRIRGEVRAALSAFETGLRVSPENAAAYFHVLEVHMRSENWDGAIEAYKGYLKWRNGEEPQMIARAFETFETALRMRGLV